MFLDQIDAGAWVRAVSDHVSEADDPIDAPRADVGENDLQSLEICVDVTDDGGSHGIQMVPVPEGGSNVDNRPNRKMREATRFSRCRRRFSSGET